MSNDNAEQASKVDTRRLLIWALPVVIFILAVLYATAVWLPDYGKGNAEAGQFGDMFGAANALFSGLAFLGVIIAIVLQKEELKLQRIELAETREVMDQQRQEFEMQNQTMRKQAFDSFFFHLVTLLNEIVNAIDYEQERPGGGYFIGHRDPKDIAYVTVKGRDCFSVFYGELESACRGRDGKTGVTLDRVRDCYPKFFQDYQSDLDHYFRTLSQIVQVVDKSDVIDKEEYIDLIRNLLSSRELLLLYYHCLAEEGRAYRPLMKKYDLLRNVPQSRLMDPTHFVWYFGKEGPPPVPEGESA